MQPDIAALHTPAVKVGGCRRSVSSKLKHRASSEPTPSELSELAPIEPADYPRPVQRHTDEQAQAPPPPHHEEEAPPQKEKKYTYYENEKHMRDLAHRKIDSTKPSKDLMSGHKGFGAAGRIAQPAGKVGL